MNNNSSGKMSVLRWIVFLPAAIAGLVIVPILVDLANTFAPEWWRGSLMELIKSAAGGAAFVALGALTVPKHQFNISIALAVLYGIFSGYAFSKLAFSGFNIAIVVFGLAGAIGVCLYFKEQDKVNAGK